MKILSTYHDLFNHKLNMVKFFDTFSSEDDCLQLYFSLKYAERPCKKCGRNVAANYNRVSRQNKNGVSKKCFRCKSCHTVIYPLSDSVFSGSTISITTLFFLIHKLTISRGNTSAIWMADNLGISYKTSHKLLMKIRYVLGETYGEKMKGTVEVDEAFFGGGNKVYNWSAMTTRKKPIIGMVERETGKVRMFLVNSRNAKTINKLIKDNIEVGSTVYTDSWRGYSDLAKDYNHEIIDHSKREYVRGDVHTNTIENIWGQFKRNIRKAHIKITDKYVQLYVNEACWRHNSKGKSAIALFDEVLKRTFTDTSRSAQKSVKLFGRAKVTMVVPPSNLIAV